MPEHSSWRDLLRVIISNVAERERIAQQMGVHPMTLVRWAQGTSVPRSSNLHQLLQVLSPDARTQFSALLGQGFPDLASLSLQAPVAELDPRFLMELTWQQLEAELIELSRQQFSPETPEEKRKAPL
jgi:transcriptional regulator with XRE-family HTH domain